MSSIMDEFPILRRPTPVKFLQRFGIREFVIPGEIGFRVSFCFFFFLLGLPMVTHAGFYWFNLLDWFVGGFPLLFFALLELLLINGVYGNDKNPPRMTETCVCVCVCVCV